MEHVHVDGVGNADHLLALKQGCSAGKSGNPLATAHKGDIGIGIHTTFAVENLPRDVFLYSSTNEWAIAALVAIVEAVATIVADTREVPLVVHGHHNLLTRTKNLVDIVEREETLVHPMQMDHVGLLELWHSGDVGACIGDINLEEVLATETIGKEDDTTLPKEVEGEPPTLLFYGHHRNLVGLTVAHNHLGADSVLLQCLHQAVGCDGRTAYFLRCVDDNYFHSGSLT